MHVSDVCSNLVLFSKKTKQVRCSIREVLKICEQFNYEKECSAFALGSLLSLYAYVSRFVVRTSPHKLRVCAVLAPRFSLEFCTRAFSCFACFASQTPGLCSAFSSASFGFVRLCLSRFVRFQKVFKSLPIIKQRQTTWNTAANWQRIVSVKTELIEKQTEQACDWTEWKATIKVVLKQNQYIWTEINVNKVVTCTRCGFFFSPFL